MNTYCTDHAPDGLNSTRHGQPSPVWSISAGVGPGLPSMRLRLKPRRIPAPSISEARGVGDANLPRHRVGRLAREDDARGSGRS